MLLSCKHFRKLVSHMMTMAKEQMELWHSYIGLTHTLDWNCHITQYGSTVYIGTAMVYPH